MHGQEVEERKRRQHMWSVPAPGTAAEVEKPGVIQPPSAPAACLVQTSADSFLKDGRKIQVGDCALFQAGNAPPFIGIIRWFSTDKEAYLKLCVNWLYRPSDVKLAKGIIPEAAPNEVFYSFHKDVIAAASLLHPCKVAFLRRGVELPLGISSFVCRRVYDITNKCLWWLTDQDYINEHQEEVDQLLDKTRLEMHAAVQSGGRSPKRLNGPASTDQLKSGSDSVQNSGNSFSSQIKGKKRERGEHATDPIKRERNARVDDGDSTGCNFDNNMLKSEVSKITEKGALVSTDGVEKLVQLMQADNSKKIDLTCRVLLADVIAATDRVDCLNKFVQMRGVPVLDEWLQEAHKGKAGDRNSPKESDKAVEELLLALLRALDKLPVNLNALQTCNIGKSVNHLRSHKNVEIQKKARSLVDTWKKRVDVEMKTNDAKLVGSSQAMTWPVKPGFSDVSHVGNRRTGSGDLSLKSSITQQSASKILAGRSIHADTVKSTAVFVGTGKQQSSLMPTITSPKDSLSKVAVGSGISDLQQMVAKEAKSSSSSQSCSSDHGKTVGSSLKEDARSSTAGSMNANKTSSGSLRPRRSSNGYIANNISGGAKEAISSKQGLLIRNSTSDKVSQSGISYEKTMDIPASEHGSNHRLIVRLPNPGRSPARSTSGGSLEDPSAGSRASSPGVPDKHEHGDGKVIGRDVTGRTCTPADLNGESWQSNDVKEGLVVCDDGERSPTVIPNEECRPGEEALRAVEISRTACSSSGNDKGVSIAEPKMRNAFSSMNALIESCAKYSEATTPVSGGDDIGMNLLASVAAGEMSKSDIVSPTSSPGDSPATEDPCNGTNEDKSNFSSGDYGCRNIRPYDEKADFDSEKHGMGNVSMFPKNEVQEVGANFPRDNIDAATPLLKERAHLHGLLSDLKEEFDREGHHNQDDRKIDGQVGDLTDCKSELRSPTDQTNNNCSAHEMIAEGTKLVPDSACKSLSRGVESEDSASCRDIDKAMTGDSSVRHPIEEDSQVEATPTDQKPNSISQNETVVVEQKGLDEPTSISADKVSCSENTDFSKAKTFDSLDGQCQEQTEKSGSTILLTNSKSHTISASTAHGLVNSADTINRQASLEKLGGISGSCDQLPAVNMEIEVSAKISVTVGEKKEECALSNEISPFVVTTEQDAGTKLDFDLNEGIAGDDINQNEPTTTVVPVYSPAIRISNFSSLSPSHIPSGPPAPITVAAPAKGSFTPPENLLKSKGELGWKGSAATSAFRPAEPRKVLEMQLNTSDVQSSDSTSTKQARTPLEIDLNVADDTSLEDVISQNSTQTTGSESGIISNIDVPARASGGLDLDLNRVDEGAENGQFFVSTSHRLEVPLLPSKPAMKRFPNGEVNNMFRDFDLNNGPGIDDLVTESVPRIQNVKNSNNMSFVSPISGYRMNNAELGSGWFPPVNSYPAVTIPSFLSDRGEQSYPMVAAAGAQRILGSVTSSGSFGGDVYRGPVLSSSPAMAFSPAATTFSYAGFPFGSSFPLASTSFSPGSNYVDSSSAGSYFPPMPSSLVGAGGAVTSPYARPYMISLPEGSAAGGSDSNRKWGRHGLDLNAGPGNIEEVKDDRVPLTRQLHAASSQSLIEDQSRLYQVAGGVLKRKEPDGGWEPERFTFKQPSWQ